jgi:hypothetical protein
MTISKNTLKIYIEKTYNMKKTIKDPQVIKDHINKLLSKKS